MKKITLISTFIMLFALTCMASGQETEASRRVYTLAAPYFTVTDDVSFETLKCLWNDTCDPAETNGSLTDISIAQ